MVSAEANGESVRSGEISQSGWWRSIALNRCCIGRVGTSFELAVCGGSDCNEGGDREQGREAYENLFSGRVGELDCSRGDGMLFASDELFCNSVFFFTVTAKRASSFPPPPYPLRTLPRRSPQNEWRMRRGQAYLPVISITAR